MQRDADSVWKLQRLRLVFEFSRRPFLPPPLIVLVPLVTSLRRCFMLVLPHTQEWKTLPKFFVAHREEFSRFLLATLHFVATPACIRLSRFHPFNPLFIFVQNTSTPMHVTLMTVSIILFRFPDTSKF